MATYREWEDNTIPYGYLITFRTYGTWLHGDERGSVDRLNNIYMTPRIKKIAARERYHRSLMKRPPVVLDSEMRMSVEMAIREVCDHKNWLLRAINVRTNHAHAVATTSDRNHSKVLNAFKAYSTRKMRERGCWVLDQSPWSDKGSQRVLWNANSLWYACNYVLNAQGPDLDDYDAWLSRQEPPADAGGSPLLDSDGEWLSRQEPPADAGGSPLLDSDGEWVRRQEPPADAGGSPLLDSDGEWVRRQEPAADVGGSPS